MFWWCPSCNGEFDGHPGKHRIGDLPECDGRLHFASVMTEEMRRHEHEKESLLARLREERKQPSRLA